jgi:hypothetical protein
MWIKVTEDHIRRGRRGDVSECAIALAVTEAMERPAYVQFHAIVFPDIDGVVFHLPDAAKRFALDYDEWRQVKPISFEVGLKPQMCVWL